jgi:hypothetical protein
MLKIGCSFLLCLSFLITIKDTNAHVQLDYPVGGETFSSGESINIQWTLQISHDQDNWDLYFSTDGGTSWEAIELDIENARLNYRWTVPDLDTDMAKIKIVQDNPGADYIGVSGDFTIQTASALEDENDLYPRHIVLHENYPNPFNPKQDPTRLNGMRQDLLLVPITIKSKRPTLWM